MIKQKWDSKETKFAHFPWVTKGLLQKEALAELLEKKTTTTNQAANTRGFDFTHDKSETSGDETSSISNVLLFSEEMK